MSTNKTDVNNNSNNKDGVKYKPYKDEIELRDLIMILWNRKGLIVAITLIFALLAGLFSKFYITPEYSAKFNIVANIPEAYTTKYGEYILPIKSNSEYINLIKSNEVIRQTIIDLGYSTDEVSVQSINNSVSFEQPANDTQRVFQVNVSGSSPESAYNLANALYENYIRFVNIMVQDRAINYYYNDYTVKFNQNEAEISSNKDLLTRHEELLAETSKTIDQKSAMAEIPNTSDYIILENIINPNYTQLEFKVIEIKENINILESENSTYSMFLEELSAEKEKINEYYANNKEADFESTIIDNLDIYRLSEPLLPTGKTGPNISRNVVIAGLLGGMISVFTAFFLAYWKREI